MRKLIYLRKSRDEEKSIEDILAVHRDRLVHLCESLGHAYDIEQEIVSGDTIKGRPVFQKVLNDLLPSGNYDGIVVNEISRLGRGNMRDAGEIYQTLIDYSIKVITPHKTYDPTNRADLRQIRFELFLSREEFEMIKDRLKDGKDASARQGKAGNNIFVLGVDTVRGKYKINEYEMETVNIAFRMIVEGKSFKETCDYLNALGRYTGRGKPWTFRSLQFLINNDHYIGYQTWQGEKIKASHGVLVDPELVYAARSRIRHRDVRRNIRNATYWVPLYCHHCGQRMYGASQEKNIITPKYRKYAYKIYVCEGRKSTPRCNNQVKATVVHEYVFSALKELINDDILQKQLIEAAKPKIVDYTEEIEILKKEIDKVNFNFNRIKQDYIQGIIDGSTFSESKKLLTGNKKELQQRLIELEKYMGQKQEIAPEELIEELKNTLSLWDKIDNHEKAKTVRGFIEKITWNKEEKRPYITFGLPL